MFGCTLRALCLAFNVSLLSVADGPVSVGFRWSQFPVCVVPVLFIWCQLFIGIVCRGQILSQLFLRVYMMRSVSVVVETVSLYMIRSVYGDDYSNVDVCIVVSGDPRRQALGRKASLPTR